MYLNILKMIERIKHDKPLILNLTNYVTMDFIANGLLSLGASPIMTHSLAELNDLIAVANGVVINIGTLDEAFITLCEAACLRANRLGKPIILDPVGVGASQYRTQTAHNLLSQFQFSVICGNASEIMALSGAIHHGKGVDASMATMDVIEPAKALSERYGAIIAVSGKTDAVIERNRVELFERGSSFMPMITGSGCLLTAVISAFHSIDLNKYMATCAAVVFYGVCGEHAARSALGPGSFKTHFLDELSYLPSRGDYEKQ